MHRSNRPSWPAVLVLLWAALASPAAPGPSLQNPGEPSSEITVMVELHPEPAVVAWARGDRGDAAARARSQLEVVRRAQGAFVGRLGRDLPQARILYRVERVLDGVALRVPASSLPELRRWPGVRSVRPIPLASPTNSTSVPFVATHLAWDPAGAGVTGDGVRIGIVDTGVDYLHTGFGGSGLAADYAANDPTALDGFFPTPKVVGGFDFVGDTYDASSSDPAVSTPVPDPDPMDCEGHGTHVAGTAAGLGVRGDGTTYPGPYDGGTDFGALAVGPGVAPGARLYALRVFGCAGTTAVVPQALEWAVDPNGDGDFSDRLDVVNLSLAAPYGSADDPSALAADRAALAGVVVVASAGNDGDNFYILGTPASAGRAIAVAASWDDDTRFPGRGVRVDAPAPLAATHQAGGANFGPNLLTPVSAPAAAADPLDACGPVAATVAGRIAVVERSAACTFVTQVRSAQQAGAVGVVIVNDRPELQGVFNDGTGGDITIPPLLIRQVAGGRLLDELAGGGSVDLTLTPIALADVAALFSSRGPRRRAGGAAVDMLAKPDLAAPGVAITSVALGGPTAGGTGGTIKSGTSMAAPHVAGLAALLLEARPGTDPQEVKATLMATGRDVFFDPEGTPPRHGPSHMGSGRIQAVDALTAEIRAFDAQRPEAVTVSFGHLEVVGTLSARRRVTVVNRGTAPATLALRLETLADIPGVELSLPDGGSLTVPAAGSAELRIDLVAEADAMRHTHDPALEKAVFGFPRHWLSEESALLVLEPAAGPAVRLAVHASARPASRMAVAGPLAVGPAAAGTSDLALVGDDVDQGPGAPLEERSLVSAFELQYVDDSGDPSVPAALDLAWAGVTSDLGRQPVGLAAASIFFGVASRGGVSSPNAHRIEIFLDLDRDGVDDSVLVGSDESRFAFGAFPSDTFYSVLRDLSTGTETLQMPLGIEPPEGRHTVPFGTDVRVLGVRAADLGLTPGAAGFDYRVVLSESLGGSAIAGTDPRPRLTAGAPAPTRGGAGIQVAADASDRLSWDPESPGLDFPGAPAGTPLHPDLDGVQLAVAYDVQAFAAQRSLGVLLLHHHNAEDAGRAEAIALEGDAFTDLETSQTAGPDPVAPGGTVAFTVEVRNDSPRDAAAVVVDSVPPAGSVFDPAASDPGCSAAGSGVLCSLGDLPAGAVLRVVVAAALPAGIPSGQRVRHRAVARTASPEVDLLDNASVGGALVSAVVPRVSKTVTGDLVETGSAVYELELSNLGIADQPDLPGPELVDALPPELELLGAIASAGSVLADPATGVVTWDGPLTAGGPPVTLRIETRPRLGTAGALVVNQAELRFDADLDGSHDATAVSDDPRLPGDGDPTTFVVQARLIDVPALGPRALGILALVLVGLGVVRVRRG
ncbi:MAG: S8 family serine peptidase [Acidobacteriota bacterium]